jgi:ABC-type sugar transport system ATPase subunit
MQRVVERNESDAQREIMLKTGKIYLPEFEKHVELSVDKGEFVGVAGLNGQGQTAFLRSLFGMSGTVTPEFNGEKLKINTPGKAIRHGFSFVSGDRETEGTFKERSIEENLHVVKQLVLGHKPEPTDDILKSSGVRYNEAGDLITSLSGGNQQKVVIGRWTTADPKLILADDPTKGIDVQARHDVHETFLRLIDKGASVIMISSDDEELVEAAKMMPHSRIIVMYEGAIIEHLRGDDINLENIAAYSSGKSNAKEMSS